MKKAQIKIGGIYTAKVSGQIGRVRIDEEHPSGGWHATNIDTNRRVRIKSAQRLRREATQADAPRAPSNRPCAHCKSMGFYPRCSCCLRPPQRSISPPSAGEASSQPEPGDEPKPEQYDEDVCATLNCGAAAVLTYLGRPRCQPCYEDDVAEPGDATEENAMSKKTTTKKSTKKTKSNENRDYSVLAKFFPRPSMNSEKAAAKPKGSVKAKRAAKSSGESRPARAAKPTDSAKAKRGAKSNAKPKRLSALDAAAQVLQAAGQPMRAQELIAAMAEQNLWKSPAGATPHATLYAAMLREINLKGKDARFNKVERGLFASNA